MAHINALPVELLQGLFELALLEPTIISNSVCSIDSARHRRHLTIPLTLSYVCAQWRSITLSTGLLWSSIVVLYRYYTPLEISILTWQLKRAGNCPLNVTIDMAGLVDYPNISRSWEFILNHLPQCETLIFPDIPTPVYRKIFPLRGPLPRLRRISIKPLARITPSPSLPTPSIFEAPDSATSLQSLHIDIPQIYMIDTVLFLTLTQLHLSNLEAGEREHARLYNLMRDCALLVDLHLSAPSGRGPLPYPSSPLFLPRLKSLSIQDCNLDKLLKSPSLQKLKCSSYHKEIDRCHLPSIRQLHLLFSYEIDPSNLLWTPAAWTHDVETLMVDALPANLRSTLCTLQKYGEQHSDGRSKFQYLPHLKYLILESPKFPFTEEHARNAVRELEAILVARSNLRVRIIGIVLYLVGKQLSDLSTRVGGRLSSR
ncbi:hypothetical protein DL93DRAFT_2081650 [Clavulina sp. PMI_390]|nr:hypothetical protein DL93DRAFT_2081650 [Clavulina sp. PMI_390]